MSTISSEWTLILPYSGGWIQVSAKIPDMHAMSDEDAKFITSIREQMLDEIYRLLMARKAARQEAQPDLVDQFDDPALTGTDARYEPQPPTVALW